MTAEQFIEDCDVALRRFPEIAKRSPWCVIAFDSPMAGAGRSIRTWLRELHEKAARLDVAAVPPVTTDQIQAVQDAPTAIVLVKQLRNWAVDLFPKAAEQPAVAKSGRPKKAAASESDCLIESALVKHHDYQTGGSIGNWEPATLGELQRLSGKSKPTVAKFLQKRLGGLKNYRAACNQHEIGLRIAAWRCELPLNYIEQAVDAEVRRQGGRG